MEPESAGSFGVSSYVKLAPGATGGWVMCGTPSMPFGTRTPCQWIVVSCGSWFVNFTRSVSPRRTRIVGPGTVPLYAQTRSGFPSISASSVSAAVIAISTSLPSRWHRRDTRSRIADEIRLARVARHATTTSTNTQRMPVDT